MSSLVSFGASVSVLTTFRISTKLSINPIYSFVPTFKINFSATKVEMYKKCFCESYSVEICSKELLWLDIFSFVFI